MKRQRRLCDPKPKVIKSGTVLIYARARVNALVGAQIYRFVRYGNGAVDTESLGYAIEERVVNELRTGLRS